jgi:hypothetical protein
MHLEVIINGRGSVTFTQKGAATPRTIKSLTDHAVKVLKSAPVSGGPIGFGAGTSADMQIAEER